MSSPSPAHARARASRRRPSRFPPPSVPQRQMATALRRAGLKTILEHHVGPYSLDCYLPELNLAIEVDGRAFHLDPARDARRDRDILTRFGIPTARFWAAEATALYLATRPTARRPGRPHPARPPRASRGTRR